MADAEYVQLKPVLAVTVVLCKICGRYDEGHLALDDGYTWVAFIYST